MSVKKRIGVGAATLALALTGAAAISSPAQAATDNVDDCLSGKLCLWDDSPYAGPLYMYGGTQSCYSLGVQNNTASSLKNRTSRTVRVYDAGNCTGSYLEFLVGQSYEYLRYGPQGSNWNDRISSWKQI